MRGKYNIPIPIAVRLKEIKEKTEEMEKEYKIYQNTKGLIPHDVFLNKLDELIKLGKKRL